ncbi:MAG: TonB family protein [Armatimonadota bacterium]
MSADLTASGGKSKRPSFVNDNPARRLLFGVIGSIFANMLLWAGASEAVRLAPRHVMTTVEITRVIIDKQRHKQEKIVTKQQVRQKVAVLKKEIPRQTIPPARRHRVASPPKPTPQGGHNRILTALPTAHDAGAADDTPAVLPGGNATPGAVIGQRNPGDAVVNPPTPALVRPAEVPPAPIPAPAPKEPTQEAEAVFTVQLEIPDELKQREFKSFVRVKVHVAADGTFSVTLRTSSGNPEIDRRVLSALNRWKWKPELKDGVAVESTQLFRFEFEVK